MDNSQDEENPDLETKPVIMDPSTAKEEFRKA